MKRPLMALSVLLAALATCTIAVGSAKSPSDLPGSADAIQIQCGSQPSFSCLYTILEDAEAANTAATAADDVGLDRSPRDEWQDDEIYGDLEEEYYLHDENYGYDYEERHTYGVDDEDFAYESEETYDDTEEFYDNHCEAVFDFEFERFREHQAELAAQETKAEQEATVGEEMTDTAGEELATVETGSEGESGYEFDEYSDNENEYGEEYWAEEECGDDASCYDEDAYVSAGTDEENVTATEATEPDDESEIAAQESCPAACGDVGSQPAETYWTDEESCCDEYGCQREDFWKNAYHERRDVEFEAATIPADQAEAVEEETVPTAPAAEDRVSEEEVVDSAEEITDDYTYDEECWDEEYSYDRNTAMYPAKRLPPNRRPRIRRPSPKTRRMSRRTRPK